jgi:hypothetical protein
MQRALFSCSPVPLAPEQHRRTAAFHAASRVRRAGFGEAHKEQSHHSHAQQRKRTKTRVSVSTCVALTQLGVCLESCWHSARGNVPPPVNIPIQGDALSFDNAARKQREASHEAMASCLSRTIVDGCGLSRCIWRSSLDTYATRPLNFMR